jgi:ABC-type bacteriocin/lantibiotic exporter with double-glycine peptidase domain
MLKPHQRIKFLVLTLLLITTTSIDMVGIASIMPFIAVLVSPAEIDKVSALNYLYRKLDFATYENFSFFLGSLVLLILIIALTLKTFATYLQTLFVHEIEYTISKRLLRGYLLQPLSSHLDQHSADHGKRILSDVNIVVGNGFVSLLSLIAQVITLAAILALLVAIDPILALIVSASFAAAYGAILCVSKTFLRRIGEEHGTANRARYRTVVEAFGAIREVKIRGLEPNMVERFSIAAQVYARSQAYATMLAQFPRYALEAIAFGGALLILLHLIMSNGLDAVLPTIAVYAFAGYRVIPAIQSSYAALTNIKFIETTFAQVHRDVIRFSQNEVWPKQRMASPRTSIALKDVSYTYPGSAIQALANVSVAIPAGATVGIVGKTGSGKSTVVDIILGLLEPDSGALEVDGNVIGVRNRLGWQRLVGYVPQRIYLLDDTVSANIAFGLVPSEIDYVRLEHVAKIAKIHDFILRDLSEGYQTTLGENGARLSGGQRHRIGIARALYLGPSVLALDESTSALDSITEREVMENISNMDTEITIILVSHRLEILKQCDHIFLFEGGRLDDQGTFARLIDRNKNFCEMSKTV